MILSRGSCAVAVFAVVAVCALASPRQDAQKVKLMLKATVGETLRRHADVSVTIEAEGQKVTIDQHESTLVTIKAVGPDGSVTSDHKTESLEMKINGEKVPQDELGGEVVKESATGRLLSYQEKEADKEEKDTTHLNERLYQASSVVFSDNPVGVGDKWTINFEDNAKLGTPKAVANYEVVGFETIGKVKVAKLKCDYSEAGAKEKIHFSGINYVEVSSGDNVKSEFKVENVPFGSGAGSAIATVAGTGNRTSGSPLKGAEGATANDPKAAPAKEEEDNIDKKMKDFTKTQGLFTLYSKFKDGRQQIYMEVPEAMLNKPVMVQATASTGTGDGRVVAGDPLSDTVISFKRMPNEKIYVVAPNPAVRAMGSAEYQRSIDRSFPESYIDSYRVEATQADRKSILLDVSNLFVSDFSQIGEALSGGFPGLGGLAFGAPDRERTYVSTIKSFPTNCYLETTYVFGGRARPGDSGSVSGDPRGTVIKVDWNIFAVPTDDGFKPRAYDPRVGYFTTDFLDFSKDVTMEKNSQWIIHWNLKKKDPNAATSEPVKPIVFWLDNAIPVEWRDSVAAGILNWNKAFEEIGYKDAIQVKQMPDKADFDHADMRYNVVRWVSSPDSAYAVSLFRTNPFTGEILNASITVDSNMVRFAGDERTDFVEGANSWGGKINLKDDGTLEPIKPARLKALNRCSYATMAKKNAIEGAYMLDILSDDLNTSVARKDYVNQFLKEVVCHEMGHILGLRHNFAGSTEGTFAQLSDPSWVAVHGNSASIMDYLPFNMGGLKNKNVPYYSQTIGTYDKWAIKYGYKDVKAIDASDEARVLKEIASHTNEPGLTYMGDEYADGVDPYVARFDSSKEPLDYNLAKADLTKSLIAKLGDRYPKRGESYYSFTNAFMTLMNAHLNSAITASFFVGGVKKNPNFHGDAGEQPAIQAVSADQQRRGLDAALKYVLSREAFAFPKKYYTYFAKDPKVSYEDDSSNSYDMLRQFERIQKVGIGFLLSPSLLERLRDQEFKSETPTVTAREVVDRVTDEVWSELKDGVAPTPLRRSLQASYLDVVLRMAMDSTGSVSAPVRTMAHAKLQKLLASLKLESKKATGESKAHYEECAMRIDKAFAAMPIITRF